MLTDEQKREARGLLNDLLQGAQGIRIQQSQLLAESTWDKARYKPIADEDWRKVNATSQALWRLLELGE
jgi:hypothetical protein